MNDNAKVGNSDFTWKRLQDRSVCLIESGTVVVPYSSIRLLSQYFVADLKPAEKAFIDVLEYLVDHVDKLFYDKSTWEFWEIFGACFHAARINALQVIGLETCNLKDIFKGAMVNGCDYKVKLKPVEVFRTSDCFSEDIEEEIEKFADNRINAKMNWLKEGCVVINGEGGKGVDIFWAMEEINGSYVVITGNQLLHILYFSYYFHHSDQRKRVAGCLGEKVAKKLISKARIIPKIGGEDCIVVSGLFSLYPNFSGDESDIEKDSFLACYSNTKEYHGGLVLHPASNPSVNLNSDCAAALKMVMTAEQAKSVIAQRKVKKFKNLGDLKNYLEGKGLKKELKDEERIMFV